MAAQYRVKFHRMEIEDFGALEGTNERKGFGYFEPFTALYGRNKCGKSTVIRACSFALLRSLNGAKESGRVAIMFETRPGDNALFQRQKTDTDDTFSFNNNVVTKEVYETHLRGLGIPLENVQYMIPDNNWDKILLTDSRQLGRLIEEANPQFKETYKAAKLALKEAEKKWEGRNKKKNEEKLKELRANVEEARKARRRHFRGVLQSISNATDATYKRIYRGLPDEKDGVPYPGSLILESEDEMEPWKGVRFAYDPYKNWGANSDMEMFSVGEQKIGAFCFLYALNVVRESPFLLLDDFDVALHETFLNLLNKEVQQELSSKMQIILVSYQKSLYKNADHKLNIGRFDPIPNA